MERYSLTAAVNMDVRQLCYFIDKVEIRCLYSPVLNIVM